MTLYDDRKLVKNDAAVENLSANEIEASRDQNQNQNQENDLNFFDDFDDDDFSDDDLNECDFVDNQKNLSVKNGDECDAYIRNRLGEFHVDYNEGIENANKLNKAEAKL